MEILQKALMSSEIIDLKCMLNLQMSQIRQTNVITLAYEHVYSSQASTKSKIKIIKVMF